MRGRGPHEPGGPLTEAAKLLEQVVARDPNYAPAWGLLGQAYALVLFYTPALYNGATDAWHRMAADSLQKSDADGQQATRLDPDNIDGYIALGLARHFRGKFVQAEDFYKQALSRDPGNPDALHQYGYMLACVGRSKDSLAIRLRLQAQEPLVPVFNWTTAAVLWENGRNDQAIAILSASASLPTYLPRYYLAQVYASMGRYNEAAESLREIPSGFFLPRALQEAVRLLRTAPEQVPPPQTILSATQLGFVYLYVGAPYRVLNFYEALVETGVPGFGTLTGVLWAASYVPVRKTERFKTLMRKAGLVDYWRARGWPDLCHPTTGDDFVCE